MLKILLLIVFITFCVQFNIGKRIIHGKVLHQDLRKVYLEKARQHHALYLRYEEAAKRYSALSRKFNQEYKVDKEDRREHFLSGKKDTKIARRHQSHANKLRREILADTKKELRQDEKYKHYLALSESFGKKARSANLKSKLHFRKYNDLLALIARLRRDRLEQLSLRNKARRNAKRDFGLSRKFNLKDKKETLLSRNYRRDALESIGLARKNLRLERKYERLHTRIVYLNKARSYRRRFRFFESKRKLYKKEAKFNGRHAKKLAKSSLRHKKKSNKGIKTRKKIIFKT